MHARGVALAATLAWLVCAGSAGATATVEGQWQCVDHGTTLPVRGARVELRTPGLFGGLVTSGFTDADGRYSLTAPHGGQYGVRVVMRDAQGVHLSDSIVPWDWYTDTPTFNLGEGRNLVGADRITDGGGNTPVCAVWQGASQAFSEYRSDVGSPPSYRDLLVRGNFWPNGGVPFTTHTVINWPGGYETGSGPGDYTTSRHEFGHTVRFAADGDAGHFLSDVVAYNYLQNHRVCDSKNTGFAFNEGWAEYWSGDIGGCSPDPENHPTVEGDVALSLAHLQERCNASRADMVRTLQANPGRIHSFAEFEARIVHCAPPPGAVPPETETRPAEQRSISAAVSAAALRRLLAHARERIAVSSRDLAAAQSRIRHFDPCAAAACDRQLDTRVLPPVLRARISALRLQVRLLAPYSTTKGLTRFRALGERAQVNAMDGVVRSFRAGVGPIVRRGLAGAQAAAAPLLRRDHSSHARSLAAGLRAARRAKLGTASALDVLGLGPIQPPTVRKATVATFAPPPPRLGVIFPQPDQPAPAPEPQPQPQPSPKQATSLTLSCPGKSAYGSAFSVSGDISPSLAGRSIRISFTPSGGTAAAHTVTTDAGGHYSDSFKPVTAGTYTIQASFDGDSAYSASSSPTCTTVVS